MQACGPGVERLAEEVLWRFSDARFAILSSDTVGTPKAADAFIKSVSEGEVDIIIGTQMAAKGHHFPHLTLVGIVDAEGQVCTSHADAATTGALQARHP